MRKLINVENRVQKIEGFRVTIRDRNGRDLRSDWKGMPSYRFRRMAKNGMTVNGWKRQRFYVSYPGLEIDVLDAFGNAVTGHTKLLTVRESYWQ